MNEFDQTSRSKFDGSSRRGVAMLLVLISLMTATVLTAAFLASRDNSAAIGENVAQAAAARWAAASGLNLARAVLETEVDWRDEHDNGVLFENHLLADSVLRLTLQDLETNDRPGPTTTYVTAQSTAAANNIEHDASAILIVPLAGVANVDLSEFSVFAQDEIDMRNTSQITRWPDVPLTELGLPLSIASGSTAQGTVSLGTGVLAIDTTVWLPPGATDRTIQNASAMDTNALYMEDQIAFPAPPEPVVPEPIVDPGFTFVPGTMYRLRYTSPQLEELDVDGLVHLSFEGKGLIVEGDLRVRSGSQLRISGDAIIVVEGDLILDADASIQLSNGGRIEMFVGGEIDSRGYIGELGGMLSGPNNDGLGHANAQRIHLFSMADGGVNEWRFRNNALFKGTVYAPHADLRLTHAARVCGRVAVRSLEMTGTSTIFYDHGLDRQTGYTNAGSPVYDDDGRIKSSFASISSLNPSELSTLAASESLQVTAVDRHYGTRPAAVVDSGSVEPTPRRVRVSTNNVIENAHVSGWE